MIDISYEINSMKAEKKSLHFFNVDSNWTKSFFFELAMGRQRSQMQTN